MKSCASPRLYVGPNHDVADRRACWGHGFDACRRLVLGGPSDTSVSAERAGDGGNHRDGEEPAQEVEPGRRRKPCSLRIKSLACPSAGAGISTSRVYKAALKVGWGPGPTGTGWRVLNISHPATNATARSSSARPGAYPYPASASWSHPHQRAHQGSCRLRRRCFASNTRRACSSWPSRR
jgi:hypothetical protein